jgi:hypothetical protein
VIFLNRSNLVFLRPAAIDFSDSRVCCAPVRDLPQNPACGDFIDFLGMRFRETGLFLDRMTATRFDRAGYGSKNIRILPDPAAPASGICDWNARWAPDVCTLKRAI